MDLRSDEMEPTEKHCETDDPSNRKRHPLVSIAITLMQETTVSLSQSNTSGATFSGINSMRAGSCTARIAASVGGCAADGSTSPSWRLTVSCDMPDASGKFRYSEDNTALGGRPCSLVSDVEGRTMQRTALPAPLTSATRSGNSKTASALSDSRSTASKTK